MPSPLAGIARFPRVRLGHTPTPLEPAPNLGAALGIDLWIKRDDCTGLALGGNKVRQLEFHFGEAQALDADTVLVWRDAVGGDRACAVGADRSGQPGAVRPHRRPAGALRLCREPGVLAVGDARDAGALTGEHGGCAGRARHRVRGGSGSRGLRAAAARPAPRAGSSPGTPAARAAAGRRRW